MASPVSFISKSSFCDGSMGPVRASSESLSLLNNEHSLSAIKEKLKSKLAHLRVQLHLIIQSRQFLLNTYSFLKSEANLSQFTCIDVTPLVTLDTADISDSNSERLIPNFLIVAAVVFTGRVEFALPVKLEFWFSIFFLSFFFHARWRFIQKVDTQFIFTFFAHKRSK